MVTKFDNLIAADLAVVVTLTHGNSSYVLCSVLSEDIPDCDHDYGVLALVRVDDITSTMHSLSIEISPSV